MKILIADDSPEIRECLSELLKHYGHQVIEVGSAVAAKDAMEHCKPDFCILDGYLPEHGMSRVYGPFGIDLVKSAAARGIRAIVHTADSDLASVARAEGIPCLLKPAGIDAILGALESGYSLPR